MDHCMHKHYPGLVILLGLLLLAGCSKPIMTKRGDPTFAPVPPVAAEPVAQHNGSIYMAGYSQPLFEDIKARQVGDLLTVILVEQTDASKKASTGVSKSTNTNIGSPTLFGREVTSGGVPILSSSMDSAHDFSGESDSSQSNKLQGNITVTVAQVLPNGNLYVQGEKWIAINQGEEYVRLRGMVRPVDIRPDNTVVSTQVADAQITYRGKGATADSNAVGWLARFFLAPLWPF
jgi:flagellar L-ring protein precursor FlgH